MQGTLQGQATQAAPAFSLCQEQPDPSSPLSYPRMAAGWAGAAVLPVKGK